MNKKGFKGKVLIVLLVLLAVIIVSGALIIRKLRSSGYVSDQDVAIDLEAIETETEQIHAEDLYHQEDVIPVSEEKSKNTYTLLVVCADDSETAAKESESSPEEQTESGTQSRNDAQGIILMTINHDRKQCLFESLHTNMYVNLPEMGGGRLGNAWAIGGGPLLSRTIEENYGVRVNNYASISLREVARVIGIDEFETLDISEDGLEVVQQLVYTLNAVEAPKIAGYISSLLPYVHHNIDERQMLRIIMQLPRIVGYYSEKDKLPYPELVTEADGYLVPDIGATSKRLQAFIYGEE